VNVGRCAMTGGTLRRLQELAAGFRGSPAAVASDEGGESGGLPVRVQLNTVHSTIVTISNSTPHQAAQVETRRAFSNEI
jgi:hypothetical protein